MTTATQELATLGDLITHTVGAYEVRLQWVGPAAYRVSIHHGGKFGLAGREIDWAAYENEKIARDEATRIVHAVKAHGSWEDVADAHMDALDKAERARRAYRTLSDWQIRARRWEDVADATRTLGQAMAQYRLAQRAAQ